MTVMAFHSLESLRNTICELPLLGIIGLLTVLSALTEEITLGQDLECITLIYRILIFHFSLENLTTVSSSKLQLLTVI